MEPQAIFPTAQKDISYAINNNKSRAFLVDTQTAQNAPPYKLEKIDVGDLVWILCPLKSLNFV